MRVVLDTSVIVAAFAAHGLCEAVFEFCIGGHEVLVSDGLLGEVGTNLRRKLRLPPATAEGILALLREYGTPCAPVTVPVDSCRDPGDLHILGLASAGKADYLVTGDKDLLSIGAFGGCAIVSPRQFALLARRKR